MRYSKNLWVFISDKYSEKLIKLRTTQDRAMYTETIMVAPSVYYIFPMSFAWHYRLCHVWIWITRLSSILCQSVRYSRHCQTWQMFVCQVLKFCYYWRLQSVCCPQGMGDVTQQASFHSLSCNDIHWCTCMKHLGGSFNEERRWKAR